MQKNCYDKRTTLKCSLLHVFNGPHSVEVKGSMEGERAILTLDGHTIEYNVVTAGGPSAWVFVRDV